MFSCLHCTNLKVDYFIEKAIDEVIKFMGGDLCSVVQHVQMSFAEMTLTKERKKKKK